MKNLLQNTDLNFKFNTVKYYIHIIWRQVLDCMGSCKGNSVARVDYLLQ